MGHQIIEFWMLCAFSLSFSLKPHKNIRKLIVLFSLLCVDFGLWYEFFAGNIVFGAPLNLFEFGCCSPSLLAYIFTGAKLQNVVITNFRFQGLRYY